MNNQPQLNPLAEPFLPPPSPPSSVSSGPEPSFSEPSPTELNILHHNCNNRQDTTNLVLTHTQYDIIALQEPWINSFTLRPPPHQAWNVFMAYDYTPTDYRSRHLACILVSTRIPTYHVRQLPSGSELLTAIEITNDNPTTPPLRIISCYNPPNDQRGLPVLKDWLRRFNDRQAPSLLLMDANLHHRIWSAPHTRRYSPEAPDYIRMCASASFKIISPRGTPTRKSTTSTATVIDLIWANWKLEKKILKCEVLEEKFGSDHYGIRTRLDLNFSFPPTLHNTASVDKLILAFFHKSIEEKLRAVSFDPASESSLDEAARLLADSIISAYHQQGKWVPTKPSRYKAWWDPKLLNPILRQRNRARRWMIRSDSPEAHKSYQDWQDFFRQEVMAAKSRHWRKFLASCTGKDTYKAFNYTKPTSLGEISPLYRADKSVTADKCEQASLLFQGTSIAHADADLSDIPPDWDPVSIDPSLECPSATAHKIQDIITALPTKRAAGSDLIQNGLLKLALPAMHDFVTRLFDACLKLGYFPHVWRTAMTAIIRKSGKSDYSEPNAYRPIALLSCLGKVLEKLITQRLTYWAEKHNIVSECHMGGRKHFSVEDAAVILTTWIRIKWREGKIVSGLFLDVKSAYPSVHNRRLLRTLSTKNCPTYLISIIRGFLSERTTKLRLQDFISEDFTIDNGLPQGSPLSVILYIIYNSSLLLPNALDPASDEISLAFIDDVTHLVAHQDPDQLVRRLEYHGAKSLEWGKTHGAIFDIKKANLMHFTTRTSRTFPQPTIQFGDLTLQPQPLVRWLGFWLDPKLRFNQHINKMKAIGNQTLGQLKRISRCFSGLDAGETKKLVTSVLRPRILFGSIIWLTYDNQKKAIDILTKLQNGANRLILGAFRTSPIESLNHDSDPTPFHLTAARLHHQFYFKRLCYPPSHPTRKFIIHELQTDKRKYSSCIQKRLFPELLDTNFPQDFETIFPYPTPPWHSSIGETHNLELSRDDTIKIIPSQIEDETNLGSTLIFTDGSVIPETGSGAAAVTEESSLAKSIGPLDEVTPDDAEAVGLALALKIYHTSTDPSGPNHRLAIFSDSQTAINLLHKQPQARSNQYLALHLQNLFKSLDPTPSLHLYWTPSHEDFPLHEKADTEAKLAAESGGEDLLIHTTLTALLKKSKEFFESLRPDLSLARNPLLSTPPNLIWKALSTLEKGRASIIFQLRSGHIALNAYLSRFGGSDAAESDKCPTCHVPETPEHFLVHCRQFNLQRARFRKQLKKEKHKTDVLNFHALIDDPKLFPLISEFVLQTKRFKHFNTYLDHKSDTSD